MDHRHRFEPANTITHGVATLLAIPAGIVLVARGWNQPVPWLPAACVAYAVALTGVFFCSTMSHWIRREPARTLWRRLDQGFIFLLIVATYTPFSLVYLSGWWWNSILVAMWVGALAGFVSKVLLAHRVDRVSVIAYIGLGWMPAMGGVAMANTVPAPIFWGIYGGGVVYTAATWFLFNDRRRWYYHAIWHTLVLAAATIHYVTTLVWVVPPVA
jgi:hemolysin III